MRERPGSRGRDTMRGPMNPSTNHECGLLIGGFDAHPMIMTTWNPPYYAGLLDAAGFSKAKDLIAFHFDVTADPPARLPERYTALANRALRGKSLRFRDLNLKDFANEV